MYDSGEGCESQARATPERQGQPVTPHGDRARRGAHDRIAGWLVGGDDGLDRAAVGVSVGLVVMAGGYFMTSQAPPIAVAVMLIVGGGLITCAGLLHGLVGGSWGSGKRPVSAPVARLRATRTERDDARRQVRRLRRELRAARRGEDRESRPPSTAADGAGSPTPR